MGDAARGEAELGARDAQALGPRGAPAETERKISTKPEDVDIHAAIQPNTASRHVSPEA